MLLGMDTCYSKHTCYTVTFRSELMMCSFSLFCSPYHPKDTSLISKLFGPLHQRYALRPGGYTRMLRIPNRKGDNAPMAIVELVDNG